MFTQGFEKTAMEKEAFLASTLGAIGGTAQRLGLAATKGISGFAKAQKTNRLTAFRGARGGAAGGKDLRAARAALGAKGPTGAPLLTGEALTAAQGKLKDATKAVAANKGAMSAKVVERHNRIMTKNPNLLGNMANKKPGFASRHPYLTAGAAFLGAKALMGNPEQPPPPPQIVQY